MCDVKNITKSELDFLFHPRRTRGIFYGSSNELGRIEIGYDEKREKKEERNKGRERRELRHARGGKSEVTLASAVTA